MLEQRIQQHFIDSADLKYQSAQSLSKPIAAAVQAMSLVNRDIGAPRCWFVLFWRRPLAGDAGLFQQARAPLADAQADRAEDILAAGGRFGKVAPTLFRGFGGESADLEEDQVALRRNGAGLAFE